MGMKYQRRLPYKTALEAPNFTLCWISSKFFNPTFERIWIFIMMQTNWEDMNFFFFFFGRQEQDMMKNCFFNISILNWPWCFPIYDLKSNYLYIKDDNGPMKSYDVQGRIPRQKVDSNVGFGCFFFFKLL